MNFDQSVRNLTNLVNGTPSQRTMPSTRYPHNSPAANMMQPQQKLPTSKPIWPDQRGGMQLPISSHSGMHSGSASQVGGMAPPHVSPGDQARSSISPSSAADRIIAGRSQQGQTSGPQAASHHSKVPSPAGAGFDERSSNQTRHESQKKLDK